LKAILLAVAALVLATASGCSTIINGSSQTVSINSNVTGATVSWNGAQIGTTPMTTQVKRASTATITVSKEGYTTKTITIDTSIEPMFWGNVILGGLLGSTTDGVNGNMYKYAPATLQIDLEKKS
jgi:hypothetical protein